MDFEVYFVFFEEGAELIGYIDGFLDFEQHPFFNAHSVMPFVPLDKHKSTFMFPEKDDDCSEVDDASLDLGIGAYINLELIP
ncbi:hypothetical protein SPHINGO8BC_50381 [Sphingobacterium multivorum]|uniref:Uncharacterized protein n=1 Tax=Sphingobacterium multivorum TaxID=28454 RepID=A0A654BTU2_SPHMU|nr:hypothetical protein SPHINGO8BC_50381 [Sphingobacterium multivorum]